MKSFVQFVHDEVSLEAIEKFANRLKANLEDEAKALEVIDQELEKARKELK